MGAYEAAGDVDAGGARAGLSQPAGLGEAE